MIFSMDHYEPIRHAIADFLKLELHTDGYTLKLANQAKDLAKRGDFELEVSYLKQISFGKKMKSQWI